MLLTKEQQLIVDLINEYDNNSHILHEKLLIKYSNKIKEIVKNQDTTITMEELK